MNNRLIYMNEEKSIYKQKLRNWFRTKEIIGLVEVFGEKFPGHLSDDELVDWLVEFSNIWDYRAKQKTSLDGKTGEKARWLIGEAGLSEEQKKCIDEAIGKLGLVGVSEPSMEKYDYILALGGARMSCLYRTKYAWEMAKKFSDDIEAVVLLGAMRPIAESEREVTNIYAPDALTEYDLMNAAIVQMAEHIKKEKESQKLYDNKNLSWYINEYTDEESEIKVMTMAAPSSEPQRRANSADTYQFWLEQVGRKREMSILLVTSQIYVPYQHIEAVRVLGIENNVSIDTIGFPVEWNYNMSGLMQYENYLQEIRSGLQAIQRLWKNL